MRVLSFDCETTISNKGNVYDPENKMVCFSYASDGISEARMATDVEFRHFDLVLDQFDHLVLFNAKFDLAWGRKVGLDLSRHRVWDLQLGLFLLLDQRERYPSLEQCAEYFGLEGKLDVVKNEYWAKGIDTDKIPEQILLDYARQDAALTYQLFDKVRQRLIEEGKFMLWSLQCQDIPVLLEMEWNGLLYDRDAADKRRLELQQERDLIIGKLENIYPNLPINFNSTDQLSAFLYGGNIKTVRKEHIGFFKTGVQAGQPKFKNVEELHTIPQMFKPLRGSEMAKEGVYSTSEDTLKQLKGRNKWVIENLLQLAKIDKLLSGYFEGYPKLMDEMRWENNIIHGTLNQVATQTGRLSAVKPK